RGTGMTAQQFADHLIEQHGVGVVAGTAFGDRGEGHVRITYAAPDALLEEGLARIGEAVEEPQGADRGAAAARRARPGGAGGTARRATRLPRSSSAATRRPGVAESRLLWEDLTEGDEAVSEGRTITEADVVNFCGVSGDFNWFHIDAEAAKQSVFGQRVAQGMLALSTATGLQVGKMEPKVATAAFMGLREWQFRGAVVFGDTIRVKRTIGEKTEHKNPAQGFCVYEIEVLNQEDKVVQKG